MNGESSKPGAGAALLNASRERTRRRWAVLMPLIVFVVLGLGAYSLTLNAKKGGDEALRQARTLNAVTALAEPAGWTASTPRPDCVGYDYEPQCAMQPIQTQWLSAPTDQSRAKAAVVACRELAGALGPAITGGAALDQRQCRRASLGLEPGRDATDGAPLLLWADENADWTVRVTTATETGPLLADRTVNEDPSRFAYEIRATARAS